MKTASNGSLRAWASCRCSARTFTVSSPSGPLSRRPFWRIASTCSGHCSSRVTSIPALVSRPPMMAPMAPAPTIPIRVNMALIAYSIT
jgi:hypothetical protein